MLLHPCVGGEVDAAQYPHAPDIAQGKLRGPEPSPDSLTHSLLTTHQRTPLGKLDVYGQLSADYVQQSAPHMHAIGSMLRRLTGGDESSGHLTGSGPSSPHLTGSDPASAIAAASAADATGATSTAGAAGTRAVRAARAVPQLVESDVGRRPPSKAGLRSPLSAAAGRPTPPSSAAAGLRSCLFCHPMPTLKINRDAVLQHLLTTSYPLHTTHHPLPTTHYPPPTTHYPLPTLLLTTHYLQDRPRHGAHRGLLQHLTSTITLTRC